MASRIAIDRARVLGVLRRIGPVVSASPPADFPAGRQVELKGRGSMFVRVAEGPPADRFPVLLLHGWTWTGDINWFSVVGRLAEEHPVVVGDHRGHGRSMRPRAPFTMADFADDYVALLDELGIERVIACGFSLGGGIAMHLAARHPDRVAGMVLQGTAACWTGMRREQLMWQLFQATAPLSDIGYVRTISARYFGATRTRHPEVASYWPWLRTELARNSAQDIRRVALVAQGHDMRKELPALRHVPSTVVLLTRDAVCRPRLQRQVADLLGAEILPVQGDHDFPIANPAGYAAATLQAIHSVDARVAGEADGRSAS